MQLRAALSSVNALLSSCACNPAAATLLQQSSKLGRATPLPAFQQAQVPIATLQQACLLCTQSQHAAAVISFAHVREQTFGQAQVQLQAAVCCSQTLPSSRLCAAAEGCKVA